MFLYCSTQKAGLQQQPNLTVPGTRGGSGERQSLHRAVSHSIRLLSDCCAFLRNTSLIQHTASRTAAAAYLTVPGARGGSGGRRLLHRAVSHLIRMPRDCCAFLRNTSLLQHTASRTAAAAYLTVPGARGGSGRRRLLHRAVSHSTRLLRDCWTAVAAYLTVPGTRGESGERYCCKEL